MHRGYRSHRYSSTRRRRSSAHFPLQSLPVELRILILEFSLPAVNDVSRHWPAPIPALLRTSRQMNADIREVMKKWSPVHYIPEPIYLDMIPLPGVVKVEEVCLSMFHNARIGILRSGPGGHALTRDHQDLVTDWVNFIDRLPKFSTIKTIAVDATPAPGWLRYDKPDWVSRIINDKLVSDRFIFEHIAVIADLMSSIAGFYNSLNLPVSIELAGLYGQKSRLFPEYIHNRCLRMELDIPFVGLIVPNPNIIPTSIAYGINELYSERSFPPDTYGEDKKRIANDRRRLLQYRYSTTSEFLFSNLFQDDEFWTMQQLENLTDFALENERRSRHIDIPISDFTHGSFVCSLARDLDLISSPRSSWNERKIRIYRKSQRSRTRGLSRTSSSLMSFLLMSAAVVLFVGILSSDARRRR